MKIDWLLGLTPTAFMRCIWAIIFYVIGNILVTENWKLKGVNDALLAAS
jgi:hypothetical protein